MAKQKDAYYFSHDSNARRDVKISRMLMKYKYGYQWYFMIIEILREQTNFKYPLDEFSYQSLANELKEKPETIKKFLDDCIKNFELFISDGNLFWSKSLLRRMKLRAEKSKKYSENAKKRWEHGQEKTDAMAMQSHSNGNAIKESKERKEKKDSKAHFFVNSPYYDISLFTDKFYEHTKNLKHDYTKYDAVHYYERVKNWSESEGKKKKDWIATARNWAIGDKTPKLKSENVITLNAQ